MSTSDEQPQIPSFLHRLLNNLSLGWVSLAFDVALHLRKYICLSPSSPYEILDYEASVELLDIKGKAALFKKRQRVKFLQNGVIAFEDYAWGDGEVLASYKCTPGVVVDKYKEGDRWNILVSLHDTKSIGDVEQFHIERVAKNMFTKADEWFQTEIRRPTRRLKMSVIFPKAQTCQRAVVAQRSSSRVLELGPEHYDLLPDGCQLVSWETNHVRKLEVYTLKWRW